MMAQRRLPFRRTSFLARQKGGQERPGGKPLDPGERPKDSGLGLVPQPAALFVLGRAVHGRLCLTVSGPSPRDGFRRRWWRWHLGFLLPPSSARAFPASAQLAVFGVPACGRERALRAMACGPGRDRNEGTPPSPAAGRRPRRRSRRGYSPAGNYE